MLASAQTDTNSHPDDEFNLFLLGLLTIFVCAMIGAAIVGAFTATLFVFLLFGLVSLGILSTSIIIGLYKKSVSAGFKSFLIILHGSGCMAIGGIGAVIINYFFELPLSLPMNFFVGGLGGFVAGLLMAISTYHVFQRIIKFIVQKLKLA